MAFGSSHRLVPLGGLVHEPARVVVAVAPADRLVARGGLERAGMTPVGELTNASEAAAAMVRLGARACVLDAALVGARHRAIHAILAAVPDAVVVLVAPQATDDDIAAALAAGAAGYLCGGSAAARAGDAIALALDGHGVLPRGTLDRLTPSRPTDSLALPEGADDLTPREQEVLGALNAGATTAQIAATLGLSAVTVRRHVSGAMRKLGGSSREDLLAAPAEGAPAPLRALRGGPPLTERERQVLRLAAAGWDNRAIADELFITTSTVKNHMTRIMGKLGARNRTEAAVLAARHGEL